MTLSATALVRAYLAGYYLFYSGLKYKTKTPLLFCKPCRSSGYLVTLSEFKTLKGLERVVMCFEFVALAGLIPKASATLMSLS